MSKNAAFLMMVALMLLLAIQFFRGQDQPVAELDYTEFKLHLAQDRIDKVTFRDRAIEGELRQPVIIDGQDYTRFENAERHAHSELEAWSSASDANDAPNDPW